LILCQAFIHNTVFVDTRHAINNSKGVIIGIWSCWFCQDPLYHITIMLNLLLKQTAFKKYQGKLHAQTSSSLGHVFMSKIKNILYLFLLQITKNNKYNSCGTLNLCVINHLVHQTLAKTAVYNNIS
jgi:hypothetical protein